MTTPIATGEVPGYHLTLSDGTKTVGILFNSPGAVRRLPRGAGVERKSVVQRDWTGGRGNRLIRDDARRFYDSGRMWTTVPGQAMPGPLARYGSGLRAGADWQPQSGAYWLSLYAGGTNTERKYFASSFSPSANCTINDVQVWVRKTGTPAGPLNIRIRGDTAGAPGATLATASIVVGFDSLDDFLTVSPAATLDAPEALTAGTQYWLEVYDPNGTVQSHFKVLAEKMSLGLGPLGARSDDGVNWTTYSFISNPAPAPCYRIADNTLNLLHGGHFFEYKRGLYFVQQHDNGSTAPKLFINGDRGVATGGSTTSLTDTTKAWAGSFYWYGCWIVTTGGPGAGQYAQISSVAGGNQLQFDRTLPTALAAGTEYVILGSPRWLEITGHGLTKPVTSVAVMNDIIYFAMGDGNNMRRMRELNVAGAWTRQYADEVGNTPYFIATHLDDANVIRLFGVWRNTSLWAKADKQAWGVGLTFTVGKPVGDTNSFPTGIEVYDRAVWVTKEDAVGKIENDIWKPVPIAMEPGRDPTNGRVVQGWNTNLHFSFMEGHERLYGHVVDDIGWNRGLGMPFDRKGKMTAFVPALQYGYASLDCGIQGTVPSGWSAVLMTTSPGGDWHEIHRGFIQGRRIRTIAYQSLPEFHNYLWCFEGPDMVYLSMSRDTNNPAFSGCRFTPEGYLTTSYFDLGTPDLDHFWHELRAFTQNVGRGDIGGFMTDVNGTIEVDYRVDDEISWSRMGTLTLSPHEVLTIGAGPTPSVTGRQIQFRLRFYNEILVLPMLLYALELRANQMNEVLYDYSIDIRLEDNLALLNGNDDPQTGEAVRTTIESWHEDATPLAVTCVHPFLNGKRVHIDPLTLVPRAWDTNETRLAGGLVLKET